MTVFTEGCWDHLTANLRKRFGLVLDTELVLHEARPPGAVLVRLTTFSGLSGRGLLPPQGHSQGSAEEPRQPGRPCPGLEGHLGLRGTKRRCHTIAHPPCGVKGRGEQNPLWGGVGRGGKRGGARGGALDESGQGDGKKLQNWSLGRPFFLAPAPGQVLSSGRSTLSHLPFRPGGTQSY